jgi:hypothetical protein
VPEVTDRLERGILVRARTNANLLRDLTFAQAAGRRETADFTYPAFVQEFGPLLERFGRQVPRLQAFRTSPDDFLQVLARPRVGKESRLAGYAGLSPIASWLRIAYSRHCHDVSRANQPAIIDPEVLGRKLGRGSVEETIAFRELLNNYIAGLVAVYHDVLTGLDEFERLIWTYVEIDGNPQDDVARRLGRDKVEIRRPGQTRARKIKFRPAAIIELRREVYEHVLRRVAMDRGLAALDAQFRAVPEVAPKTNAKKPGVAEHLGPQGLELLRARLSGQNECAGLFASSSSNYDQ